MSRTLRVTDPQVAHLLEEPRRRRLLLSLVARERSLKEAADLNSLPMNLAHYHLRQLLAAELVQVTREEKRAGRPIRYYRSRYAAYFVPAGLMRSRPTEKLSKSLNAALEDARLRSDVGVIFDVDDFGRSRMNEVARTGAHPLEIWRRLRLSQKDARGLFAALTSVLHQYESLATPKGSAWTIHLAIGEIRE